MLVVTTSKASSFKFLYAKREAKDGDRKFARIKKESNKISRIEMLINYQEDELLLVEEKSIMKTIQKYFH